MTNTEIKTKLHDEIEHSDARLLKIIYAMVKEYNDLDDIEEERYRLVQKEREDYLNGTGKSYSWAEVKQMALNKQRPDGL